jgi:hypothetical protein
LSRKPIGITRRSFIVIVLALALLGAACGDDGDSSSEGADATSGGAALVVKPSITKPADLMFGASDRRIRRRWGLIDPATN